MEKGSNRLPEGWRKVRLGEVCDLSYGKNLSSDKLNDDGLYKVYGANGVIGYYTQYTHEDRTVLISCRGEYSGTINITDPKSYITNNSIPLVIKDKNKLDTNFLYYRLKQIPKKNFVSGSAQPQVVISDIKNLEITFPINPSEQQKIAEILKTLDEVIEKTDKIIEKYKRIKQGLMQALLTRGIDEKGRIRDEKTYRFKDSPIGRIPEEWEVVKLGEVCEHKTGIWGPPSPDNEKGFPIIRSTEIVGYRIEPKNASVRLIASGRIRNYILQSGDILINKSSVNPYLVGWPAIFEDPNDGRVYLFSNFMLRLRIDQKRAIPQFVLYYLHSHDVRSFCLHIQGTTSGLHNLQVKEFMNQPIPLPPLHEQQIIARIISQVDQVIEKEKNYKQKLERIKKGLMEDLLTGKVRVKISEVKEV